jgi:hypothetical protein
MRKRPAQNTGAGLYRDQVDSKDRMGQASSECSMKLARRCWADAIDGSDNEPWPSWSSPHRTRRCLWQYWPRCQTGASKSAQAVAGTTGGVIGLLIEGLLFRASGSHWSAVRYLLLIHIDRAGARPALLPRNRGPRTGGDFTGTRLTEFPEFTRVSITKGGCCADHHAGA